jgi:NADPH-dependent 2,4-dienoyl-CoA reductase/sulfur reductase-like enzyme
MTSSTSSHGAPGAAGLEHVVVVGAGAAGHAAAERLREAGFAGRLTIVGDEPHRPYNRTPLSKQLLTGTCAPGDLTLPSWTELDATWRLGTSAAALDTAARTLSLSTGEQLRYDGLVLAVGVDARALPGTPLHSPHVHLLRTLADAVAVDQSLGHTWRRVVVVGGGFIGCEIASTCRARGLDVTVVDVSPTLLHRGLGERLGAVVTDLHRAAGVEVRLGVAVHSWDPHGQGVRVQLEDGHAVDADMAVVGVGTAARTGWLADAGLDVTDGILAGPTCHAWGADDVVVAGDVARWPNLLFDSAPRRVEHWINALEMGRHAADSLLTGRDAAQPFTPVPRFWSEQHGVKIQSLGLPTLPGTQLTVVEGDGRSRRLVATATTPGPHGHRLTGVVTLDNPRRLLDYAPLIGRTVTSTQHARSA